MRIALKNRYSCRTAFFFELIFISFCLTALSACAVLRDESTGAPNAPRMNYQQAEGSYQDRASHQTLERDKIKVSVAALRDEESAAKFGIPMAKHGLQPVWVKIENRSALPYWFMPAFMDRDFYSAREAAFLFHSGSGGETAAQIERIFTDNQIKLHIEPGKTVSGFVYTNLTRGIKLLNVELLGANHVVRFDFAREQPDGFFDYQTINVEQLYPKNSRLFLETHELGAELQKLPCCTTDNQGSKPGDPLNLVMVGSEHDVLVALVRAGWDFTETINASSVSRMIKVFAFGGNYRNSPVSALYLDGRPQDFAMQRARASISQRNHLRLWMTPLQVNDTPVWVGQISRDIGVKITSLSPTLTTHVIDPDVDESRDYLLQDMLMTSNVARWGYALGVGAASLENPRFNLMNDSYFTDGRRLVIFISKTPRTIQDAEFVQWHPEECQTVKTSKSQNHCTKR